MKLATYKRNKEPRWSQSSIRPTNSLFFDLHAFDESLPHSLQEILALDKGLERARQAAAQAEQADKQITGTLLAPLPRPGKVLCIGLNYRDHAEETGMPFPDEPVCFSKFSSAVTGPGHPIRIPTIAKQVDYEAELVVVIGKNMP